MTLKKSKIEATRSPRLTSDHPLPHPDRSTPLKSLPVSCSCPFDRLLQQDEAHWAMTELPHRRGRFC